MILNVRRAVVVIGREQDTVFIDTSLTEATYPYTRRLRMMFEASAGEGVAYVKENFGLEADTIEIRKASASTPQKKKKKKKKRKETK